MNNIKKWILKFIDNIFEDPSRVFLIVMVTLLIGVSISLIRDIYNSTKPIEETYSQKFEESFDEEDYSSNEDDNVVEEMPPWVNKTAGEVICSMLPDVEARAECQRSENLRKCNEIYMYED